MAKSSITKFPRITPLRAFDLLRDLDVQWGRRKGMTTTVPNENNVDEYTHEALANHVKNALRRAGSR